MSAIVAELECPLAFEYDGYTVITFTSRSLLAAAQSASNPYWDKAHPTGVRLQLLPEVLRWNAALWAGEFENELRQFPPRFAGDLLDSVNAWRGLSGARKLVKPSGGAFQTDVRVLTETAALRWANEICASEPLRKRLEFFKQLLSSGDFVELGSGTPAADECLDRVFGLNERVVKKALMAKHREAKLFPKEDLYLESAPEDLFTPYLVLQDVFACLSPKGGEHFVDLGSGLGRVGIFAGLFFPHVKFTGVEVLKERAEQGARVAKQLGLSPRVKFLTANVKSTRFKFPDADYYFLFNPFSVETLKVVLAKIQRVSALRKKKPKVVAVRVGRPPAHLKRQKWLSVYFQSADYEYWDGLGFTVFDTASDTSFLSAK